MSKYLKLPKGYKRAQIIEKSKKDHLYEDKYDAAVIADFEEHRASYIEVEQFGVTIKVKVQNNT